MSRWAALPNLHLLSIQEMHYTCSCGYCYPSSFLTQPINIHPWCMKNALEPRLSLSPGICFIFRCSPCASDDSWRYLTVKNSSVVLEIFERVLIKVSFLFSKSLLAESPPTLTPRRGAVLLPRPKVQPLEAFSGFHLQTITELRSTQSRLF